MKLSFERATPADAETLRDVQVAAFHSDTPTYGVPLGGPPGYDQVAHVLRKIGEDEFYKILADGQIIGGIVVSLTEPDVSHLDLLYLDPAYHNRGIGTQAMHFIEQTYPASLWTLDTPAYATRNQHFYEQLGYVKVGEFLEETGILLFEYEKRVSQGNRS